MIGLNYHMNKKYQVFVSSTFLDLQEERKKISEIIFDNGHIPVGMELFPASTLRQWEMIKEYIDTSDYYILIVGFRYGTITPRNLTEDDNREISYTQQEYEYAYKKGIPVYTFFQLDNDNIPEFKREKTERYRKKLDGFKKLIQNNGYYFASWKDINQLSEKVMKALNNGFHDKPRPGWVRSDYVEDYNSNIHIQEKLIYYKFLHLTDRQQSDKPVYSKFIKRLDKYIEVYDEYITLKINRFSGPVKKFRTYDSTKGTAIEVNSLLPFVMNLRDADETIEENPQIIQPMINGPSNVYVTSSHYYNGFQLGNRDAAVKADKDAGAVRLIVDFSSIKDYKSFIAEKPTVFYNFFDENGKLKRVNLGEPKMLGKDIYFFELNNMKTEEVLKIEFDANWDHTANIA